MSIYKACDIRGVYPDQLDDATTNRIGRSLAAMVRRRGGDRVAVGGDYRESTPWLKGELIQGLLMGGVEVLDCGQAPTPVIYSTARKLGCDNVCIITASHNPPQYNGVKFMVSGRPAVPELMRELQETAATEAALSENHPAGKLETVDAVPDYVEGVQRIAAEVASRSTGTNWRRGGFRMVADAANGAFSEIAPLVLRQAGFVVLCQNCEIDGQFGGRSPNPAVDANLAPLQESVLREAAAMGVAFDGDGDRVAFVAENGEIVRPEQVAALLVDRCYPRPTAVFDLKCASVFARAVARAGGRALMQPSGHGFIKSTMIDASADIGVEISGHFFFKELGGGDDALFTALLLAEIIAASGVGLSSLVAPYPWPAITPDIRLPYEEDSKELLNRIQSGCGAVCSRLDGVRADYETGWALARASITEPLITFRFEATEKSQLPLLISRFLAAAPDLIPRVMKSLG